jgi:secreted trypsin-like serine protease
LISPNYVLTAAHCVKEYESVKVIHYEPLLKKQTTYEVSNVLSHPRFGSFTFLTLNDFAILKLKVPVKKTNIFVCLPSNQLGQFVGANMTVSGWGLTSLSPNGSSNVLKSGFVTAMHNSDCSQMYENLYNKYLQKENPGSPHATVFVPQTIICVNGHITKSSPCIGDSGGK